ncbi:hypothetical protein L6E12_00685 [Actinokineospora sp. PR83]|uniref:hypothetical protein n=1 Tax=Actinokineospora sp. PR83 TaxID=2884908 RepID=UPI001F4693BF|nr:hypothetical protein [Actinokineospora sp. PR83]MCG8914313.1 hypothetical protein [Actinokineospora sp. PR83]
MANRLGHKQTAAMFALMGLAREVSNPELEAAVGFTLDGKERKQLNDLQLVESVKRGRPFFHRLTDNGRAWCEDELAAGTPPPPAPRSTMVASLYIFLGGLERYLRRENLALGDVFPAEVELTEEEVESRIRTAYRKLARSPGDWVGLADVRPLLGEAPAAFVDTVLKRLSRARRVQLAPDSDRKALTAADHEAAIRIGGLDNHLLLVEAS